MFLFFLQIEREKADLSVQVIQMSERLEEAEGGAEHQVSLSKRKNPTIGTFINNPLVYFSSKLTASAILNC